MSGSSLTYNKAALLAAISLTVSALREQAVHQERKHADRQIVRLDKALDALHNFRTHLANHAWSEGVLDLGCKVIESLDGLPESLRGSLTALADRIEQRAKAIQGAAGDTVELTTAEYLALTDVEVAKDVGRNSDIFGGKTIFA
jgi:ferritin-like metal-binding protein YciE